MKRGVSGACGLMLWGLAGCATVLEPPGPEHDAQVVYLIDHGRHPSLVLPDGEGGAVRYAYGDWTWFAEGDTGFLQAVRALLWPTNAALGRQPLDNVDSPAALQGQIIEGYVQVFPLEVSSASARSLTARLDRLHAAGWDHAIHRSDFDLTFVPHPERYWFFNNSNTVTARWLESLGVEVRGFALFSSWEVAP